MTPCRAVVASCSLSSSVRLGLHQSAHRTIQLSPSAQLRAQNNAAPSAGSAFRHQSFSSHFSLRLRIQGLRLHLDYSGSHGRRRHREGDAWAAAYNTATADISQMLA